MAAALRVRHGLPQAIPQGKITRGTERPAEFTPEAMEPNFKVVDFLKDLAARNKSTPRADRARLAAGAEAVDRPIPGTTKLHRLEENLGAADVELTADDLAEIVRDAAAIQVEGERYPEQLMKTVGR